MTDGGLKSEQETLALYVDLVGYLLVEREKKKTREIGANWNSAFQQRSAVLYRAIK